MAEMTSDFYYRPPEKAYADIKDYNGAKGRVSVPRIIFCVQRKSRKTMEKHARRYRPIIPLPQEKNNSHETSYEIHATRDNIS